MPWDLAQQWDESDGETASAIRWVNASCGQAIPWPRATTPRQVATRHAPDYPREMQRIGLLAATAAICLGTGCESKQDRLDECDNAYADHMKGCDSPTQPEPDRCREYAAESRWLCRQQQGVNEPKPKVAKAPASSAKPAKERPKRPASETDLAKVCDGTGEPTAAAYDAAQGSHNAALVAYQKLGGGKYTASTLGADYEAIGPQGGANKTKASAFSLVVCVTPKEHTKVLDCPFKNGSHLEVHDGSFEIRVLEAKTAKQLATETVALKNQMKVCPGVWNFWSKRDISLPLYKDAVLKLVKTHVDP